MPDLRTERTAAGGGFVLMLRFVVTSILNYGFGVALVWLLPRAEFGAVSVLQNVLLLSAMVLVAGMPWVLARKIAQTDAQAVDAAGNHAWHATFRSAVAVNLALATVLVGALLIVQATPLRVLPDASFPVVAAVALTIVLLSVNSVLGGGLHGSRRFDALGAMQTAEIATKVLVGLALVALFGFGTGGVALGFLAGAVVATCCSWWGLRDRIPGWGPLAGRATTRLALPTGAGTGSVAFLVTLDVLVLSALGRSYGVSTATIAVYQVAAILARIPYYLGNALGDAVFPYIASGRTRQEGHAWFVAVLRWVLLALVPLQLVLLIAPTAPLRLLFPSGYTEAADLLRIMTVGTFALLAADLLLKALYGQGFGTTVARRTPVAVVVLLAGLLVLVPRWGATGAAVAFALGSSVAAVLLGTAYVRHHRSPWIGIRSIAAYATAAGLLVLGCAVANTLPEPVDLLVIAASLCLYVLVVVRLRLVSPAETARASTVLVGSVHAVGRVGTRLFKARSGASRRVLLLLGCVLPALVTVFWNISRSPDSLADEMLYTRAAQLIGADGHIGWDETPIFVHPPLSFLAQAGWLRLVGRSAAPMADAIVMTRLLAGLVAVLNVVLIALLAHRLMTSAGVRRRTILTLTIAALAATDPILLRYCRVDLIEPFALFGCLVTLHVAVALRHRASAVYIPAVGLATGLTLLTKELAIFLLLTPVVHALLGRDWRYVRRAAAALTVGLGLWLVFPLWALLIGRFSDFMDVKFLSLERLVGVVQTTGWNQPGKSFAGFVSAVFGDVGQYASSFALLAGGSVVLLWLLLHRTTESARWLLAWLITSYAFGAYSVLLGTFNEHFFVYLIPAALVGSVLVTDAVAAGRVARQGRRRSGKAGPLVRAAAVPVMAVAALLSVAVVSWARFYLPDNNGLVRAASFVRENVPTCSALNGTGDSLKYAYLLPGYSLTGYATGPSAVSHGVHLFFLSNKDAALRTGNASPTLNNWVRSHGVKLASFPSAAYRGVELWRVSPDPNAPLADTESIPGGEFVVTEGSRCGGFAVRNSPAGNIATTWEMVGGKGYTGPPMTASWTQGGRSYQVFQGVVLVAGGNRLDGSLPIVTALAATAPAAYREAYQPPVVETGSRPLSDSELRRRLTDPAIARAYLGMPLSATPASVGGSRNLLGEPVGPPTVMPDGQVRQAFAGAVLEHPVGSEQVRMSSIGKLALEAGILLPPPEARRAALPPPSFWIEERLALPPTDAPATAKPFLLVLAAALAVYALITILVMLGGRHRRPERTLEVAA